MIRYCHSQDRLIRQLREAATDLGLHASVADLRQEHEMARFACYHERNQIGGIKAREMRRLREMVEEFARFKPWWPTRALIR